MDKNSLVQPYVADYMQQVRRGRDGMLGRFEQTCRSAGLPVSGPETSDLLEILCRMHRPERILEIGTCVGFSAMLMHTACPSAEIVTIERNPAMIMSAKLNFEHFGVESIRLLEGDAADILPTLEGLFDLIFIDAAKGQYISFFDECCRLLRPGGMIAADNVLFNGCVASGKPDIRRNQTIVCRLRSFIDRLENDCRFKTVILPVGDGVSLSYRLREDEI